MRRKKIVLQTKARKRNNGFPGKRKREGERRTEDTVTRLNAGIANNFIWPVTTNYAYGHETMFKITRARRNSLHIVSTRRYFTNSRGINKKRTVLISRRLYDGCHEISGVARREIRYTSNIARFQTRVDKIHENAKPVIKCVRFISCTIHTHNTFVWL